MVPTNTSELAAMAFVLGRTRADPGALLEEYRRLTRRARLVTERLFYGSVTA
jgi:glutamate-ammonia-ligase adenylyltransferase